MRITPKEVKVNRNVIEAAATMAGRSKGSVTRRITCSGEAPSVRAASSRRGSSCAHSVPTVRMTTARLKYT